MSTMPKITGSPNGLGMWKVLVSGEVRWLLMKSSSLVVGLRKLLTQDAISLEMIREHLEGMGAKEIAKLVEEGLHIEQTTQLPGEALFVPPGWIVADYVSKGPPHLRLQEVLPHSR